MDNFVVVSGCSGGGKSTLLMELARRGYAVVDEPGRRVIDAERKSGGTALPWVDLAAFARRAMAMAIDDRAQSIKGEGWVFFDRGLIDAAAALQHATGEPALDALAHSHRYNRRVFLTPPWPEIYRKDADRQHDLDSAVAEYERLLDVYPSLGYDTIILPKVPVGQRAAFVLDMLAT
ncbi:AAA family ATPase [Fodinicurvata sp. EGI_FJ10296]|uniref:AAA family ATPase n=1 Tax=Fodinicurvata sp. EGI_FJ10296 TaxID=3231908 RepID=UPI003452363F